MISKCFLLAIKLCLSASIVTGVVLLLRPFLKKAPRAITCALWILVGLRLVIPVLPESKVSVIPEAVSGGKAVEALEKQYVEETTKIWEARNEALYKEITMRYQDMPVYQEAGQNYVVVAAPAASLADPSLAPSAAFYTPPKTFGESVVPGLSAVWIIGAVVMLLYMIGSYLKIRKLLGASILKEPGVYLSDEISSPFILGLARPRIYLPSSLGEQETAFVLAHERAHLKRGDQIWKPLGFVLLAVYWFNPLFWLAYFLLCRDIESACDEKVIREQSPAYRKAYSETLLALNIREKAVSACPLAFAENGVKSRIKSVLSYKKPAFWLLAVALIVSLIAAGCALTDPSKKEGAVTPQSGKYHLVKNNQVLNGHLRFDFEKMTFYFGQHSASAKNWYQGGMFIENGLLYAVDNSGYIPDGFVPDRADMEKRISDRSNARFIFRIVDGGTLEYLASGSDPLELNSTPFADKDILVLREEAVMGGLGDLARQKIEASFPSDENGGPIYPDDYAGNYPDGKNLVLCLKDPDEAAIRRYLEIASGFEDSVHIKAVSHSYNELMQMLRETAAELLADKVQVNLYSVDVENNGLHMGVSGPYVQTVRARLQEKYPDVPFTVTEAGPFSFDLPETEPAQTSEAGGDGPGKISTEGTLGGTPLINPDSITGTYTFSEGVIRDYIGEWGDERYFILQIVKPGHPDMDGMYRYAVGHARKDAEDGTIQILADLDCDYYHNVSKLIDGTLYVATEKGIYSVTTDGNVKTFIGGKEQFATYPSAGNMFLYRYGVRNEKGMTFCLEAYYFWPGVTIRYLTLENAYGKESNYENNRYIVTASALEDGFCYVLSHGDANEVWYQPCTAKDIAEGVSREPVLLEKNQMVLPQYVAGNEQFYVLVYGAGEPTIHLVFRDEPATSKEVKTGAWGYTPLQATSTRTGKWCFTCRTMWFDVDVEKRECTVYKAGGEDTASEWNLFGRTAYSREIVMQGIDGTRMLFAQDESYAVDYAATPLTDFRLACGTSESKDKAEERGLSAELKEAGGLPVFRLDSEEDLLLFSKIFDEPAPNYGKIGLKQALQTYDSEFFREKVLFAVYGSFGPSSLEEEYFRVGSLLRNNVLHLRLGVVVPLGTAMTADLVYSWILVPVERSDVRDVTAYDATLAWQALPPDWTEGVNPDWRKQ